MSVRKGRKKTWTVSFLQHWKLCWVFFILIMHTCVKSLYDLQMCSWQNSALICRCLELIFFVCFQAASSTHKLKLQGKKEEEKVESGVGTLRVLLLLPLLFLLLLRLGWRLKSSTYVSYGEKNCGFFFPEWWFPLFSAGATINCRAATNSISEKKERNRRQKQVPNQQWSLMNNIKISYIITLMLLTCNLYTKVYIRHQNVSSYGY